MESQLIIFDLDGTLIDSRGDLTAGVNHARAHFGLAPLPVETVSGYIGNGVRKLVERSMQGAPVDLEEALRLNKEYYYSHLTVHTKLYDGVDAGLKQLVDAGHQIAILTNKPGGPSRKIMKDFALDHLFTAIIGGGDVPNLKPEPDGIFKCLDISGMDPSRAWMVGDHYTDLAVGENAGIRSVLVEYGFGEPREYKPEAQFASFPELVGYFV